MSCNVIVLMQEDQPINLTQSGNGLELNISPEVVNLIQSTEPITLIQQLEVIQVCAQNPVAQFIPFYFSAVQDQTVFTLPAVALSCQLCAINGTSQSQAKTPTPDFTITDNILTLSEGVDLGDLVFGVIQIA